MPRSVKPLDLDEKISLEIEEWDAEEAVHSYRDLIPDDDIVAIEELLMEGTKRLSWK